MISKVHRLISVLALFAVTCLTASPGRAESIDLGAIPLLEHTELAGGEFGAALGFVVPMAGTVSVGLEDLSWPAAFDSLVVMIIKGVSVLGSLEGPGEFSFDASSPGRYFALVMGDAGGDLDLGLYSLNIQLDSIGAPVPLPAAAWLLLSGAAGLAGFARRRSTLQVQR